MRSFALKNEKFLISFLGNALTIPYRNARIYLALKAYALVAQLDRVSDYESEGQGFESLSAHQMLP